MRLQYEIAVDARQVRTVMRGVEGEITRNARAARAATAPTARVRQSSRTAEERAEARLAGQRLRYEQKIYDQRLRLDDRAHQQRLRQTAKEEAAHKRAAAAVARERMATARGVVGGAARSIRGTAGTLLRFGGAAAGLVGGFAAAGALDDELSVRRKASQLANQAGNPALKGELTKEARSFRGFTGTEALEGLTSFVDITGDLGSARSMMKDMANVALATTTELTDLGSAMGSAFIPISDAISDPTERLRVLNQVMRATAGMGAVGAVEVKDLASEMAGLAATSSRFSGGSERSLNLMVAFAQAARQRGGASSAAEAVTSVQRFASDILTRPAQEQLAGIGVDVFTDKSRTKLRDAGEIMVDVVKKTGGDQIKLQNIFGERGFRAAMGFSPLFTKAEEENAKLGKGQRLAKGVAGERAVRGEMQRLLSAARSDEQIQAGVKSRLEDPDIQIKEATKAFNEAVGSQLVPVIIKAIPEFTKAIPAVAKFTGAVAQAGAFILNDPLRGIGAIIAAKLVADIGSQAIGKAVGDKLTSLLGQAGAGMTVGTVALAAASVILVADQLNDLSKAAGGKEGIMAGIGALLNGESFFKGVDDFQNEQALKRSQDPFSPDFIKPGESFLTGAMAPPSRPIPPGTPLAAPEFQPQAQQSTTGDFIAGLREQMAKAATDQQKAASELRDAAAALKGAGTSVPEASRVAPMTSPSRG